MKSKMLFVALVVASVVAGVCLRISGIDRKSFWGDELEIAYRATQPSIGEVLEKVKEVPSPPLYFMFLWKWTRAFGDSDFAIRSLPCLIGILTLPVSYFAWQGLIGKRSALWSVALIALNFFHACYSNDSKMYALVWLLSTLSCGAFVHIITKENAKIQWWFIYGSASACLPIVSYVGLAALIAQSIYAVGYWAFRPDRRKTIERVAVLAFLSMEPLILWSPYMIQRAVGRKGIAWIPTVYADQALHEFKNCLSVFLFGFSAHEKPTSDILGSTLYYIQVPLVLLVIILQVLVSTILFRAIAHRGESSMNVPVPNFTSISSYAEIWVFLAVWSLLPLFGVFFFSLIVYPLWGVPRYLTAVAPGLILWVSMSFGLNRVQGLATTVGILILTVNLSMFTFEYSHKTRIPWKEIISDIGTLSYAGWEREPNSEPRDPTQELASIPNVNLTSIGFLANDSIPATLQHELNTKNKKIPKFNVTFYPFDMINECDDQIVLVAKFDDKTGNDLSSFRRQIPRRFYVLPYRSFPVYEERYGSLPSITQSYTLQLWLLRPKVE